MSVHPGRFQFAGLRLDCLRQRANEGLLPDGSLLRTWESAGERKLDFNGAQATDLPVGRGSGEKQTANAVAHATALQNPTGGAARGCDSQGCGEYGASRGRRVHQGLDIEGVPGQDVVAAEDGTVSKIGWPYRDRSLARFRYIEVTHSPTFRTRYHYVQPGPGIQVGTDVKRGQNIGTLQRLPYAGITQHVHFEVWLDGQRVDPRPYLGM